MDRALISSGNINPVTELLLTSFAKLAPDTSGYDPSLLHCVETRFRHFASAEFSHHQFKKTTLNPAVFNQKKPFHTFHQQILPTVINPFVFTEIKLMLQTILKPVTHKNRHYKIGINQIRMTTTDNAASYVAPDFHQDGYDFSIHICLARQNILGGISQIASDTTGKNILTEKLLSAGEYIIFDDKRYYHTATPINSENPAATGYRDMLIIDVIL